MDRLKFNNIPHPAEVLGKEEYLEIANSHDLDGIALSLYIDEMKKHKSKQQIGSQSFNDTQRQIAKEYLEYLLQSKLITSSVSLQEKEKKLISRIVEFKHFLAQIETRLEKANTKLEEEKHKIQAQRVMSKEAPFSALHFDDIHFLKGDVRSMAEHYNIWLKARTTDEMNQRYKLDNKSFGYRFLILLGENQIDTKGNKTR